MIQSKKVNIYAGKFRMKEPLEEAEHAAVCEFIRLQYPKVLFNTDLSGIRLTEGLRRKVASLRSNTGFPDIVIYEPRGRYFGLFIEMKRLGESPYKKDGTLKKDAHIEEQARVMELLKQRNYYTCFCAGAIQAQNLINQYMQLGPNYLI